MKAGPLKQHTVLTMCSRTRVDACFAVISLHALRNRALRRCTCIPGQRRAASCAFFLSNLGNPSRSCKDFHRSYNLYMDRRFEINAEEARFFFHCCQDERSSPLAHHQRRLFLSLCRTLRLTFMFCTFDLCCCHVSIHRGPTFSTRAETSLDEDLVPFRLS